MRLTFVKSVPVVLVAVNVADGGVLAPKYAGEGFNHRFTTSLAEPVTISYEITTNNVVFTVCVPDDHTVFAAVVLGLIPRSKPEPSWRVQTVPPKFVPVPSLKPVKYPPVVLSEPRAVILIGNE